MPGGPTRSWRLAYHVLLLGIVPALSTAGVIPWRTLLAFAPALWRAAMGMRRVDLSLDFRRLGWSEVALTALFVGTLVLVF